MKAAIVLGAGQAPIYGDFPPPEAQAGEERVTIIAAALSPVVRGRAAGKHYSAPGTYPFIAGVDGVGRLDGGRRVLFFGSRQPYGSMAEATVVPIGQCVTIPDALDDVLAAAIANPGVSSWAALRLRAGFKPGETVLINGATGTSGRLAVQVARHLGAGKVIATARNAEALQSLGADETIQLTQDQDALEQRFQSAFANGVDVVIDYLWGQSAERLLMAAARAGIEGVPIRFVQVGSISGPGITLPSAVLRSSSITLMGSGLGGIPLDSLIASVAELLQAAATAGFTMATRSAPLAQLDQVWNAPDDGRRIVFTI
ncbi:zinc-binding alcohol dehydrogenase family protein [Devosia ginsengisoli]|uniref:quinone oxidoreductase family protein n=1 Tax=Devosia ginsengisoli TaxID=400770 RepID=UPI0026F08ED7|nr:zinc-binding alcohol dehydrogenase family protein [Devosia ginsengisoli]MCR6671884.1 zinc-binding alcohol dehydrogenase family protein [Devosia ginsengisoli]